MPQTSVTTTPAKGVPGQIADLGSALGCVTRSKINEEASASIGFGLMVGKGTADDGVLKLATTADVLEGIVVFAQNYRRSCDGDTGQLDDNGLTPKTRFAVLEVGEIWVQPEGNVAPGNEVHVRAVAAGAEKAGAFRATADGTNTIDITPFARWLSTGTSSIPAKLQIDLRNAALATADT